MPVPDGFVPDSGSTVPAGFEPDPDFTVENAKDAHGNAIVERAASWLPTVGGAVGGAVGGIPGAALGGAAGAGYEQLLRHLMELPSAFKDVARLALEQPGATAKGFMQGALGGATSAATDAVVQGGAQALGEQVIAPAVRAVGQRVAPALMQSALKPGIRSTLSAVKNGQVAPVVKTLLDEGVNVTPGGIDKLSQIIGASNDTIQSALDSLPSSVRISPQAAASRTADTVARFSNQVDRTADVNAIQGTASRFLAQETQPAVVGSQQVPTGILDPSGQMVTRAQDVMGQVPRPLTIGEAQALKTGTYAQLKNAAYGTMKPADIEAQKAIARGLKEEIASEASNYGIDITAPNAREGAALSARDAVAKRVALAGNRDPVGLAWLAHNPTTFLVGVAARSPAFKSLLARGLYQSAARAAGVSPQLVRIALGAVSTSSDPSASGDHP